MNRLKVVAAATAIMCAVLAANLVGAMYRIDQQNGQIEDLKKTKEELIEERESLVKEIEEYQRNISRLAEENKYFQTQLAVADNLTRILMETINGDNAGNLKTIVVHVDEKDTNIAYVYDQIKNQTMCDVFLLPQFEGNLNWTKTYNWLLTNFTDIPIVLSVFEGGEFSTPNVMLNVNEINQALTTCNVEMVRLAEIISWYMGRNQTFPTEYVRSVLNFCKQRGLKVLWSEWKISDDAFQVLKDNIVGFEDIVTVAYQTNNEFDEPIVGFLKVSDEFPHWGASVQPWYWTERHGTDDPLDMPISLLVWHALLAKNMGAEILQFEPYWYFFDYGEAMEQFNTLRIMVF